MDRGCYRDKKPSKGVADEESIFEPDPETLQQMKFTKGINTKVFRNGPVIRYETGSEEKLITPDKLANGVKRKQLSNSS